MTTPDEIVWEIKQGLYDFTKKERDRYAPLYELIEAHIVKNKLLLSNLYRLTKLEHRTDSLLDFHYVIYCSNPLEQSNLIVNAIYEKLNSLDKKDRLDTLSMNTAVMNEEFFISYDNRIIVKIFAMQHDRPKGKTLDLANIVVPTIIDGIPFMPPEIEIIDVYTQLYSEATKLKEMIYFENSMLESVIGKIGGEVYSKEVLGGNEFNAKQFLNSEAGLCTMGGNEDRNSPIQYPIADHIDPIADHNDPIADHVIGGRQHSSTKLDSTKLDYTQKSCYERKKDELEALKVAIVNDFFIDRKDIAIVGPVAVEWEKSDGNICPKYDRIQVIGNINVNDLKTQLTQYLATFGRTYEITTGDPLDILVPKDFRTKRTVFSMVLKTDMGIKEKPFLEFFNSCDFELVPVFSHKGIMLGNKWVTLKFLFIDLWVTKFIYSLGKLDKESYNLRQRRSLELIRDLAGLPFKADGTMGIYDEYEVAKKERKINQEQFFYPYFPHAYFTKNNKLRMIR